MRGVPAEWGLRVTGLWRAPNRRGGRSHSVFCNVRFWHIADVPLGLTNVCFEGNNGHDVDVTRCVLMIRCGHSGRLYPVLS
jgi:hypothetical protein